MASACGAGATRSTMGRFCAAPTPSRIWDQFLCPGAVATSNLMSALMICIGTVTRTLTLCGHKATKRGVVVPKRPQVEADSTLRLVGLFARVDGLLTRLSEAELSWAGWLAAVAPKHRSSARNLVHYWAIRQYELRELQTGLAVFGLSSLGRSESHVQATLAAVRSAIAAMVGGSGSRLHRRRCPLSKDQNLATTHGGAAGAPPRPSHGTHHGHAAIGGRDRPRVGTRIRAARHEHRTDQLRPR